MLATVQHGGIGVMAQMPIRFRDSRWFDDIVQPAIETAVAVVGLKEFAYQCDSAPSLVADQIAERNSKALRFRQWCTLVEIAPAATQDMLSEAGLLPSVYKIDRRATLTDKERADALERELLNLGPIGAQVRERALGGRR